MATKRRSTIYGDFRYSRKKGTTYIYLKEDIKCEFPIIYLWDSTKDTFIEQYIDEHYDILKENGFKTVSKEIKDAMESQLTILHEAQKRYNDLLKLLHHIKDE
jgi:hypothetical protein